MTSSAPPLRSLAAVPSPADSEGDDALLGSVALVERLAGALHRYGTPAHRLEEAMVRVGRRLGLAMEFFSTPTAIFAAFHHPRLDRVRLMRLEPGEVNLEKLTLLDQELSRVLGSDGGEEAGSPETAATETATAEIATAETAAIDTAAMIRRIDDIVSAPVRYGPTETTFAFAFASGSAAFFFGGGVPEIVLATLVGLGIGLLALVVERWASAGRLFELLAALLAAWGATTAAGWMGGSTPFVVVLAGLIVLVPGLSLTVAMTELASRHLVSGASRLAGVLLVFLTLGFGVALGTRLGELTVGEVASSVPVPVSVWGTGVALVVAALAFTVLFRARPQDAGWVFLAAVLAWVGSRTGAHLLGPQLGALVGAVLVGLGGNLHARWLDRPAAVTQVPGLMLLVPGSLGFRSVASLLEKDTLSGIQTAFSMGVVAVALVVGLLLANVILPPRGTL